MTDPLLHQHRNVSEAYKLSGYHGLNQREAMAEALRYLIASLYMAKDAYEAHLFDVMDTHNSKTLRILAVLRDTIHASGALQDHEAAPYAQALSRQYHGVFSRLVNILRAPDVAGEYDALIAVLRPLHHAWQQVPQAHPSYIIPYSIDSSV